MPKRCSVCANKHRQEIDEAILEGKPFRMLTERFSVSASALWRHKQGHLLATLVRAQEIKEVAMAGTLLEQLRSLQQKALELLAKAEAAGDYRGALAGVVAARGTLEVLVSAMSKLSEAPIIQQQNITINQGMIDGAIEALLDCRAIALPEGEYPRLEEGREDVSVTDDVNNDGGDMSRGEKDRCSGPPLQIA